MRNRYLIAGALSFSLVGVSPAAHAQTNDFNEAGDTAGWTVDRYAPDGFVSGVSFGGEQVLEHSIGPNGATANRPAGYSSSFYNTQGMQSPDFAAGTTNMSIDLFVPGDWANTNNRMAGFWGIAYDGVDPTVSSYPIIGYSSDALFAGWRGWDNTNGWFDLGGTVNYDGWNSLNIALNGANWDYSVNGSLLGSTDAGGSTYLARAILQGYNDPNTAPYAIHWDNLSATGAVPEPATWMMLILGFLAVGGTMRMQKRREKVTVRYA